MSEPTPSPDRPTSASTSFSSSSSELDRRGATDTLNLPLSSLKTLLADTPSWPRCELRLHGFLERTIEGRTWFAEDREHSSELTHSRIAIDLDAVDAVERRKVLDAFRTYFTHTTGAHIGQVEATVVGRLVHGAFGFGHLAVSRPLLQASHVELHASIVTPA